MQTHQGWKYGKALKTCLEEANSSVTGISAVPQRGDRVVVKTSHTQWSDVLLVNLRQQKHLKLAAVFQKWCDKQSSASLQHLAEYKRCCSAAELQLHHHMHDVWLYSLHACLCMKRAEHCWSFCLFLTPYVYRREAQSSVWALSSSLNPGEPFSTVYNMS